MKTLFSVLAAAAVLGFAAPSTAKADHFCHGARRVVSYLPCGTPVYAVYQVVGYDRCGNPVGQWVTLPVNHGNCGVCNPRPSYGYGHGNSYVPGCRPGFNTPFFGRPRSGISFSFGFGR